MWNYDDSTFLGLGFLPSTTGSVEKEDAIQDTVHALMQECLSYHTEQEALRQVERQQQQQPLNQYANGDAQTPFAAGISVAPHFVPSLTVDVVPCDDPAPTIQAPDQQQPPLQPQQLVNEGKTRALAVLARFAQPLEATTTTVSAATASHVLANPLVDFAEQRRLGLAREDERKERAFWKNIDYVVKRENERIATLNEQLAATQSIEQAQQVRYAQVVEQRRKQQLAAVSTTEMPNSRANKRPRKESSNSNTNSTNSSLSPGTAAIYVSGIPTTSPNDPTTSSIVKDTEMLIRSLFASYGAIVKLHLYRHKSKGAKIMDGNDDGSSLKGDCLVVYSLEDSVNTDSGVKDSDNDAKTNETVISRARQRLVETVCAQMNRAELPTGHVLHVEPAYADRGTSDTGTSADNQSLLQGVSEHAVALDEVDPVGDDSKSMAQDDVFKDDAPTGKDEDDDLDEFFDSL